MIIFKYRKEIGIIDEVVYRPVVDVEFKSRDNEWIELHPYLDSGADISLIPLSFGKLLGLEINKEEIKELGGIGSDTIPVVIKIIPVRIRGFEFDLKVAWCLKEEVPALLGRSGIFEQFHINFKQDEKIIEFTKITKSD